MHFASFITCKLRQSYFFPVCVWECYVERTAQIGQAEQLFMCSPDGVPGKALYPVSKKCLMRWILSGFPKLVDNLSEPLRTQRGIVGSLVWWRWALMYGGALVEDSVCTLEWTIVFSFFMFFVFLWKARRLEWNKWKERNCFFVSLTHISF